MPDQEEIYKPIDCEFHDRMEALATTRRRVHLLYATPEGGTASAEGVIVDIFTLPTKEEFLRLDSHAEIRLDRIRSLRLADANG